MRITTFALAGALFAGTLASPALADSFDIGKTVDNSGQASFWTDSWTFDLPADALNPTMTITDAGADDRFVVLLNGVEIFAAGIYGPGDGFFHYTAVDANNAKTYLYGDGLQNVVIGSGFLAGTNTLSFIINDTYQGIGGDFTNGAGGPAGPTSYNFQATIAYDVASVPEASTWAMMVLGFGIAGGLVRRRRIAFATA